MSESATITHERTWRRQECTCFASWKSRWRLINEGDSAIRWHYLHLSAFARYRKETRCRRSCDGSPRLLWGAPLVRACDMQKKAGDNPKLYPKPHITGDGGDRDVWDHRNGGLAAATCPNHLRLGLPRPC
jgi:hypothetical protein